MTDYVKLFARILFLTLPRFRSVSFLWIHYNFKHFKKTVPQMSVVQIQQVLKFVTNSGRFANFMFTIDFILQQFIN